MDPSIRLLIAQWGATWGLPDLAADVSVTYSARLSRSLGRCRPSTGRITIRAELQHSDQGRMAEVLCHEVAHVAAFQLYGRGAAPHGPEWQQLVLRAGFRPQVRAQEPPGSTPLQMTPSTILSYAHRCPVCQSVRYARRPVGRWRCAECREAGLGGELVITRHPNREACP